MYLHSAFPTSFWEFPSTWDWSGTLPTLDARGRSTCITTQSGIISYEYFEQPATITMPPMPSDIDDPRGWQFEPDEFPLLFLPSVGPENEDAWSSCGTAVVAPIQPGYAAAYVVETSRSFESGLSTPASTSSRRPTSTDATTTADAATTDATGATRTVVMDGGSGPQTVAETAGSAVTSTCSGANSFPLAQAKVLTNIAMVLALGFQLHA